MCNTFRLKIKQVQRYSQTQQTSGNYVYSFHLIYKYGLRHKGAWPAMRNSQVMMTMMNFSFRLLTDFKFQVCQV